MSIAEPKVVMAVAEMDLSEDDKARFAQLVAVRQQWKLAEDEAKDRRAETDKAIDDMMLKAGIDSKSSVQVGDWLTQRVTKSGPSKLEPRKLLELGVSSAIIKQSTVEGKPYSYIMIKAIG